MYQVCPLCADADDVDLIPLDAGAIEYVCRRVRSHPGGEAYVWAAQRESATAMQDSEEGPASELGMLDDLLACVPGDEPWLEYGIVERRYRDRSPDAFAELVTRWGHLEDGVPRRYTASSYIGTVLAMLRRRGLLASLPGGGRGTGYWAYTTLSSYWARPPAPAPTCLLTFHDWAVMQNRSPDRP